MKKPILFTIFALLGISLFSQGIKFEENHNLNDALTKAKAENKLVFIDAYASWCGPCKMMAAKIFPLEEVGNYYNTHFINLKLDMEALENLEIAKKYDVKAYPTYLFLNADGEVAHRALGGMPAEEFIKVAQTAGDSENNALALTKKIKSGDKSAQTLKKYLELNPYDTENEQLAVDYFDSLTDSQKIDKEAWEIFNEYIQNPKSAPFQYFLTNRAKFETKIGKKEVETKLMNLFVQTYYKDKANFESLKSIDLALFEKTKEVVNLNEAYGKFRRNGNDKGIWTNFINVATPYLDNKSTDTQELNRIAWIVYENYKKFNDTQSLKSALGWAKKAHGLAPDDFQIMDTYAHLLYASGKKKEALTLETKALELVKKTNDNESIEFFEKSIEEFKK
ncbi:MAG: thioredoxin domain-containing protein [Paludibacteraceae bacterium]